MLFFEHLDPKHRQSVRHYIHYMSEEELRSLF